MASESKSTIEVIATSAQVISVVIAALISVLSFNSTRVKEAEARELEAAKPLLTLRHDLYAQAVRAAAVIDIISTPLAASSGPRSFHSCFITTSP